MRKLCLGIVLVVLLASVLWLALDDASGRGSRELGPATAVSERSSRAAPALAAAAPVPSEPAPRAEDARVAPRALVEEALDPASLPPTSRGQLVDASTLEPIAHALVATSKRNDTSDAHGWFDTGDVLDGLAEVMVVNVGRGQRTHEVPRERWRRLARGWQIPLVIGPTFQLVFVGSTAAAPAWRGRLAWTGGGERNWQRSWDGPPPFLRYDVPFAPELVELEPWLEVQSADGLSSGRARVPVLSGIQRVEIELEPCAVLRGRVLDERGEPWSDLVVRAVQLSGAESERLQAATTNDGAYQLSAARPGSMLLLVGGGHDSVPHRQRFAVPAGVTDAPDVVLRRAGGVEAVRGLLRCGAEGTRIAATLRLRALDGSGYEQSCRRELGTRKVVVSSGIGDGPSPDFPDMEDDVTSEEFAFEGLAPGRYELSVTSAPAFPWSPSALVVTAPSEGLVLACDDGSTLRPYVLDVVDEDGQPLSPLFPAVRVNGGERVRTKSAGGAPFVELPEGARFEWFVWAPGRRAARGTERDFEARGDTRHARLVLEPGYSAGVQLRDCSAPNEWSTDFTGRRAGTVRWLSPAPAGAELFADGEHVATSDEFGWLELDLAREPERVEVRLHGWRVLEGPDFRAGKLLDRDRPEIWMVRE